MNKEFMKQAKKGPVYITDVREKYNNLDSDQSLTFYCVLNMFPDKNKRVFEINIPKLINLRQEEHEFVKSYINAEIYNILTCLGGESMDIYIDTKNERLHELIKELNQTFDIHKKRSEREGYGRCINVIERMYNSISAKNEKLDFEFKIKKIEDKPDDQREKKKNITKSPGIERITESLKDKTICGVDIGGTSIKLTLVDNGQIICLKNYYWSPAEFTEVEQLIRPVEILIRLLRVYISTLKNKELDSSGRKIMLKRLEKILNEQQSCGKIKSSIIDIENNLKEFVEFDAIGISFPDVCVRDKIVGGEVYKTRGIRENPCLDYEKEFLKLTNLDEILMKFCSENGQVKITNDGNMAAFTASVENGAAASSYDMEGIFAHTLGTELGTGWVNEQGQIPEVPLECYNIIIDLGNFQARKYHSDDLRSIRNFNTGLSGTVQKYTGQSGVFRLAIKYFSEYRPDLYQKFIEKGFILEKENEIIINDDPKDMRSDFLRYISSLFEEDKEVTGKIYRKIGEYLAVLNIETQRIFVNSPSFRILFGGLLAEEHCAELIVKGAEKRYEDIALQVADGLMARTVLMKQLKNKDGHSISQFAQAIGAVYYAVKGLLSQLDYSFSEDYLEQVYTK